MQVVRANLSHLEVLALLFDAYRQFYNQASDLEGARDFLQTRLEQQESVVFLALQDNRGLGFTQLYPSFSSVSLKRLWILNDLFVAPQARRLGVARALLNQAQILAVETGAKGLMLETATSNIKAQALYESLGWKRETDFYTYYLSV